MNLWQDQYLAALELAVKAHHGQTRFNSHEPYVLHPMRVHRELLALTGNMLLGIGGLCHDILEDTKVTESELAAVVGPVAMRLVKSVTKNMALPKAEREMEFLSRYRTANLDTVLLKLADRMDNVSDLASQSEGFASRYRINTRELLLATPEAFLREHYVKYLMSEIIVKGGLSEHNTLSAADVEQLKFFT